MTISQIKYVLAVAEHQSFTKAAQQSHVTQPTLSMQIQKLEEELGIIIFDRKTKPLKLTEAGKKIIHQAQKIVAEADRMQDIVDQQKGFVGGDFTLGIIPTVAPTLLPMFLKTFAKKFPKVQLKIEEINTKDIVKKIERGHLDAGIAATPLENIHLKERPIYYEPFVAYITPGHRLFDKQSIDITDLDTDDILLLEDGHCFRDGVLNLCQSGTAHVDSFQIKTGSFETLIKLSNEGMGMTLLPYLHTLEIKDSKKHHLRFFKDPSPAREISIIQHKNLLKEHIVQALFDTITAIVRGAISFQDVKIISPLNKSKEQTI